MTDSKGTVVVRSGFVTGLAWTFIAFSAFATVMAILQNIMLALVFPVEEMRAAMQEAEKSQPMPGVFRFMFRHFQLFFIAFFALSVGTLISSIGLLKRKNWARLVFIGLMGLGVIWNLLGLAMPFFMTSLVPEIPVQGQPELADNFRLMFTIMMGFTIAMCLAFAALFVWVIKRLVAEDIKREFGAL